MKLKHYDNDGRVRFITFCTHQRLPLLTNDRYRRIVVDSIQEMRQELGFLLIAYVIMPEHVHLVLLPRMETKVGTVVGEIKRLSAKRIHPLLGDTTGTLLDKLTMSRNGATRFAFWQKRCFDHNCRSASSVSQKVDYCHSNPVKRGLVHRPADWPWSSYRWYQGDRNVVLKMDGFPDS